MQAFKARSQRAPEYPGRQWQAKRRDSPLLLFVVLKILVRDAEVGVGMEEIAVAVAVVVAVFVVVVVVVVAVAVAGMDADAAELLA